VKPTSWLVKRAAFEPYIATGREPHHKDWRTLLRSTAEPPGEEASPKEKMAYKLQTKIGQAIYRLRKCTVEPVIGIIKEILGFRQFSLRGLWLRLGEWCSGVSGVQSQTYAQWQRLNRACPDSKQSFHLSLRQTARENLFCTRQAHGYYP
jgi:hypothetical protein